MLKVATVRFESAAAAVAGLIGCTLYQRYPLCDLPANFPAQAGVILCVRQDSHSHANFEPVTTD